MMLAEPEIIHFDSRKTVFGIAHIAVSKRGLLSVQLGGSEAGWLRSLESRLQCKTARSAKKILPVIRQVEEYAAGERRAFTLRLDWRGVSSFAQKVLRRTQRIPYGHVLAYGDLARLVGAAGAARAIGNALGKNPFLIVVPCHRVIAANGDLGGYSAPGGLSLKQKLLSIELGLE